MTGQQFIADHVKPLGASGIRRVFDLAASCSNPINLSIGQPDFPVPSNIKDAMIEAIRNDHNDYTVTQGILPLRERIARELKDELNWSPDLLVTCGVSGGLLLALMACINPGDEVLMPDPYFVSYKHLVHLVGGTAVPVNTYDDFQPDPERFAAAVTDRTKIVLLCSPANPTGVVTHDKNLAAIAEMAQRRDLLIISDEIYNMLAYDGPAPSMVRFAPERTVLLRGYGKSYALTGLRLGYAAGPSEVIAQMSKLQQYTFVCAPHPAQYGALAAMDTDMSAEVDAYRAKRNLICRELEDTFDFVRPSGGFYLFPKVPSRFTCSTSFVDETISRNLLIIPGNAFSEQDTHFRVSYAAADDQIRQGCEVLRSLAG